jgi:ADP-ribose pyrophosphatase YjhB (NUDIX family)
VNDKDHSTPDENPWLKWAIELQFIAQVGIIYCKDPFDRMRYNRIREIAAEMMSLKMGQDINQVKEVYCNETGFQTPKLDARVAIFRDNKILLVKESNGCWSMPGGWVDVHESIKTSIIKEVKEESGYNAIPLKIIALQDRNKHNKPVYAYGICKVFVLCEVTDGDFIPNEETTVRGFFELQHLPLLATAKNNKEQIDLCFQAYNSTTWETTFD